ACIPHPRADHLSLTRRSADLAEACFEEYAATTRHERAAFLNAIADEIEKRAEAITLIGTQETGLPDARLNGERGRTTGPLRLFRSEEHTSELQSRANLVCRLL